MSSLPTNPQRHDRRKTHALEEQRQHEHSNAGVLLLLDSGTAKGNDARQVEEEDIPRPDETHEEGAGESTHGETALCSGQQGRTGSVRDVGDFGEVVDCIPTRVDVRRRDEERYSRLTLPMLLGSQRNRTERMRRGRRSVWTRSSAKGYLDGLAPVSAKGCDSTHILFPKRSLVPLLKTIMRHTDLMLHIRIGDLGNR